ncbi:Uncharacterised protein [uncultured archaeon]|nr:Uncharacterised protein [uncultured archaeon]
MDTNKIMKPAQLCVIRPNIINIMIMMLNFIYYTSLTYHYVEK